MMNWKNVETVVVTMGIVGLIFLVLFMYIQNRELTHIQNRELTPICEKLAPDWATKSIGNFGIRADFCYYYNGRNSQELGYREEIIYLIDRNHLGKVKVSK